MSATDITPVVARITNRIETVTDIGLVHAYDVYDREDLRSSLVSSIGGTDTLRAWWISGPRMTSEKAEQRPAGYQHRWWTYTIHGVTGLSGSGDSIAMIRSLALSVADALDADWNLNGTCHTTEPCTWPVPPEHRVLPIGAAVAYVEIAKRVLTLSTPT